MTFVHEKIFRRSVRPKWCGQFFRRAVSQPFSRHPRPSQLPSHYHPKNHPKPKTKIHKIWIKRKPKIKCQKWRFLLQNWKKHAVHYWPGLDSFSKIFEEICRNSFGTEISKNHKWTQKRFEGVTTWALSVCTVDGKRVALGDFSIPDGDPPISDENYFPLNELCYLLNYCLACETLGEGNDKNYESKLPLRAIESKFFIRKSNFKKVFRFASDSSWPRWVFTSPGW